MILSIESSLPTFKPVRFHEGLNVLLSDSRPEATEGQTRNSAGKTSLVEIIHFLLGADCDKTSLFRTDALIEHMFFGEFQFEARKIRIGRTGSDPSKVFLFEGLQDEADIPIRPDRKSGRLFLSNENWKMFLGHHLFGLPKDDSGTIYAESYTPTFRSMISYFARRRDAGAFLGPERQAEKQSRWDWQENLSYLFGLDWRIPYDLQKVRQREGVLEELKKAAKQGVLGAVIGTVPELRSKLTVAENKAKQRREQLDNFRVLDSYTELSTRAAKAKTQMQQLSRETVSLRETLNHLQESLAAEQPPDVALVQQMYAAAGVELPGVALKRLDEVRAFHESIIRNRSSHLQKEIAETQVMISDNARKVGVLDNERQDILQTLKDCGALEDFLTLQRELADLEAEAAQLRERFKAAEILEGEKTQLELDRKNIHLRLQHDHRERKERLDEAILLVADIIAKLYDDRAGRFEIAATDNGPEFRISIEGDRGGGIANVEIFCLDLTLLKLTSARTEAPGPGPGFLLHDSHLFDGVDERQISRALQLGFSATEGKGLQYIVTMNSDIFDRLPLPKDIEREKVVLPTRLSDETETGGLFGFRFD